MRRAAAVLSALGFLSLQANAAIELAVHKIAKDLTGAESTALAAPGYESKAGNMIAVWTITFSGGQPVGLVTDSAGDTFKPATAHTGAWNGQWFFATNVTGDPFNVVTIHPTTSGRATFTYPGMIVLEYSGVDRSAAPANDAAGPRGSLSGWTSETVTVSAGDLILVGIVTANGGKYAPGPGLQMQDSYFTPSSSKFSFATFDQIVSAPQPGTAVSVTWTGTYQTTAGVLSFRPANP
jgi:hypothetical protein